MLSSLPLDPGQTTAILIVSIVFGAVVLIAIPGIIMTAWSNVITRRADAALKSEMLARGMSAAEIVQVINARTEAQPCSSDMNGIGLPTACEAVVQRDGEWVNALVLQTGDGAFYVHYVGGDIEENEWVSPYRLRVAVNSPLAATASSWCSSSNGVPRKEPMPAEV
jgi:hypothetical protein